MEENKMIEHCIEDCIVKAISGGYDLIDGIFNLDKNIDFAFKDVFVPLVVKGVLDVTDDGHIDNSTVTSILNTAYDAIDKQFNLNMQLDFGFKALFIPMVVPLISGGVNSLLGNASR